MDFTQDLSTSEDTSQITTANLWCGLTGSLNFCSKVNLKYNRDHLSTRKNWRNTWRMYKVGWILTSFRIMYWYFYYFIENRAIRIQERSCILQDKGDCLYPNKNTSDGWDIPLKSVAQLAWFTHLTFLRRTSWIPEVMRRRLISTIFH